MDEAARLLTLLALVGGALTVVGAVFAYHLDETRRVRRTLTQALGDAPQPMLSVKGRGTGIGFNLATGAVCVTWDRGGWRLDYRMEDLVGVEMVVDRQVAARAFRNDTRRGLDSLGEPTELVRLRFVFDDPTNPDFELDLWRPEDEGRRGRLTASDALREANRWMARMEALMRRSAPRPPVARTTAPVLAAPVAASAAAAPLFDDLDDDVAHEAEDDHNLTL